MARAERFINIAYNTSKEADSSCTFLVGAVLALGSRIIATAACSAKTHPKNPKLEGDTLRNQLCAECKAIFRAQNIIPRERIKECSLYVARSRRDGSIGMSRPCSYCQNFLKDYGIRSIFYTTNAGNIERME